MTAAPLLRVEGVFKYFGGVHAVDGVSFALHPGRVTALIGPNGAGKSTLFAVIAGQYVPDRGRLLLRGIDGSDDGGHDIGRLAAPQRAALGIARTFQTAQAFGTLTALENVQLARAAHAGHTLNAWRSLAQQHVHEAQALLVRVGLGAQATRAAADLPYADLKRLELAIALAAAPRLLLMDEPTAGMAPAERFALMDLVRALSADTGLTVLFTEHSMDVVFGYAERLLVLSRGRLIADGAPDVVRRDPAAQAAYFGDEA
jgi:ABC-type branched-subunit amino acid transport system ATPase component